MNRRGMDNVAAGDVPILGCEALEPTPWSGDVRPLSWDLVGYPTRHFENDRPSFLNTEKGEGRHNEEEKRKKAKQNAKKGETRQSRDVRSLL